MEDEALFAKFDYYLDESDPDIVLLRRQDGAFVAAFSAIGATRESIAEAAKEDYGRLMKEERISLECPYSPECVEEEFYEVGLPIYGVLGS